jgi:hypothetical protein
VTTVPAEGWANLKNGELLKEIAAGFDVFVTVDRNLRYQQNLSGLPFAIVVLLATSNRLEHLAPLLSETLIVLQNIQPGEYREVGVRRTRRKRGCPPLW